MFAHYLLLVSEEKYRAFKSKQGYLTSFESTVSLPPTVFRFKFLFQLSSLETPLHDEADELLLWFGNSSNRGEAGPAAAFTV